MKTWHYFTLMSTWLIITALYSFHFYPEDATMEEILRIISCGVALLITYVVLAEIWFDSYEKEWGDAAESDELPYSCREKYRTPEVAEKLTRDEKDPGAETTQENPLQLIFMHSRK